MKWYILPSIYFQKKTTVEFKCFQPLSFWPQTNGGLFFPIHSQIRNKKSDHYLESLGTSVLAITWVCSQTWLFPHPTLSHNITRKKSELPLKKKFSLSAISHLG